MTELELSPTPAQLTKHAPPQLSAVSKALHATYTPPRDNGVESNLLVLMHGDTDKPFADLAQSLNLPQTCTLSLRAPERIPLLEEEAYQWWTSFTELGELIPNPNPTKTVALLVDVIKHLTAPSPGPAWRPDQIHFFGFAQGGSCAAELALAWSRHVRSQRASGTCSPNDVTTRTDTELGSLVAVSAPLLSHPSIGAQKSSTKALIVNRPNEERMISPGSWKKAFETVKQVVLDTDSRQGQAMLRGQAEWIHVMRWAIS
ncbi:hypothetical protein OIV83_003395 [Microbotryomycetes sp. JL201]|nr:hypothetical protein OIV83_003395 [Microbotryomycetes sp. JL201]